MATGRAITCDRCDKMQPFTDVDWKTLDVPAGWIRVSAREPRRWNWTNDPMAKGVIEACDFCSISCLTSWTYDIPFENE